MSLIYINAFCAPKKEKLQSIIFKEMNHIKIDCLLKALLLLLENTKIDGVASS